jgi:hypothetical protein
MPAIPLVDRSRTGSKETFWRQAFGGSVLAQLGRLVAYSAFGLGLAVFLFWAKDELTGVSWVRRRTRRAERASQSVVAGSTEEQRALALTSDVWAIGGHRGLKQMRDLVSTPDRFSTAIREHHLPFERKTPRPTEGTPALDHLAPDNPYFDDQVVHRLAVTGLLNLQQERLDPAVVVIIDRALATLSAEGMY